MNVLTRESALTLRHGASLIHAQIRNADGTPLRARVNGKCQTWVTRPSEWRLPCKHGLKQCFDITQDNAHYWFAQS
jgi:hypothetical protein